MGRKKLPRDKCKYCDVQLTNENTTASSMHYRACKTCYNKKVTETTNIRRIKQGLPLIKEKDPNAPRYCIKCSILLTPDNSRASDIKCGHYTCKSCRSKIDHDRRNAKREKDGLPPLKPVIRKAHDTHFTCKICNKELPRDNFSKSNINASRYICNRCIPKSKKVGLDDIMTSYFYKLHEEELNHAPHYTNQLYIYINQYNNTKLMFYTIIQNITSELDYITIDNNLPLHNSYAQIIDLYNTQDRTDPNSIHTIYIDQPHTFINTHLKPYYDYLAFSPYYKNK